MYGDFARVTFGAGKNRSRVLMQQGRVQLEADWNEQGAIFSHLLQTLARDLIGPGGGPQGNCGFAIITRDSLAGLPPGDDKLPLMDLLNDRDDFLVGKGHYYVDGLLCDIPEHVPYSQQPVPFGATPDKIDPSKNGLILVYADVIEHAVFAAQDESQLEVAIGVETALRARRSWVVRTAAIDGAVNLEDMRPSWPALVEGWQSPNRGRLRCRAGAVSEDYSSSPCNVAPESRYRGAENQLYRIEVHQGGVITPRPAKRPAGGGGPVSTDAPTFKFSRVNGSAVYPVTGLSDDAITLGDLGRDDRLSLQEGDWVEILDDASLLSVEPEPLRQVASVESSTGLVTLKSRSKAGGTGRGAAKAIRRNLEKHPFARRWDQHEGGPVGRALQLQDGVARIELGRWLHLEDGVEVFFEQPPDDTQEVVFRAGDYWLAPARTATGGIIDWPPDGKEPKAILPDGVEHHYAPLAILKMEQGALTMHSPCRKLYQRPLIVQEWF